ncbi:MAG: response regulator transcription factor [Candidatus Eremiobacteraeota bacterium]|nr:response regulator transcription factor [Candidatus Eremiobacteraeota bacterium]MBV9055393.1 response regulator transcription factor [Candidatus Eremiobacteraeota bacterium]MBV9700200.1 response regulator transcription factor [Candidatus Eremiobacteraeota bacterium]
MDTNAQIRVLIVEKQVLFAKAVAQVLSADPEIKVVGINAGAQTATLPKDIDIVIIDIDNEEIDDVVEHFKARSPGAKICALSAHTQGELMQHCLSAGAEAYIVKDSSLQELVAAIKTLAEGSSYVDPRVAASLLRRRAPSNRPTNELSPREREIIRLIAQGLSNRDIGRRLVLSEKTIKNHVSHIFAKIHCTARSQAAVHAIRIGLA